MTSRERNLLLLGLAVGAVVVLLFFYFGRRDSKKQYEQQMTSSTSSSAPSVPGDHMQSMAQAQDKSSGADSDSPVSLELSEEEQKSIGVQVVEVRKRDVNRQLIAVGKVEEAETRLSTISARIGGRIDKLYINFTGQSVRRGQPIAEIYSPEVVSTVEEYKLAVDNVNRLGDTALPEARSQAKDLVDSARRRLELWGVSMKQLDQAVKADRPVIHVTTYSSTAGVVTERKVTQGQYVKEGDALYAISDLSRVWVIGEIYEADLPSIRLGQQATILSDALPGRKLSGQVSFIEPQVMQETRTVRVRIEVPNPDLRLRPGMFVNAEFKAPTMTRDTLAVPRTAVIDTGMAKVVYVAKGEGTFERRKVEIGPAGEEYYPILSGLREGERVVARGSFMLDSQTRLSGGMTGQFGGSKEFSRDQAQSGSAGSTGQYKVTFRTDPDPPKGAAENTFYVAVTDSNGQAVSDAEVRVGQVMPAMPSMGMAEMRSNVPLKWNGKEYEGAGSVPMAGSWNVTVEVIRGGKTVSTYRTRVSAR